MSYLRRGLPLLMALGLGLSVCSSSGSDTADPAPQSGTPTCAARSVPPGRSEVKVRSAGRERSYIRYVPKGLSPSKPAALVVDLTAYSPAGLEESFSSFTKPDAEGKVKADEVGAVVVTPDPVNGKGLLTWNVSRTNGWTDDQRFVADLIKDVEDDACVDAHRVLVMGFAIGAVMASTLACEEPELITAVATVSGLWDPPTCTASKKVPVLSFHGTDDHFLPYTGGVGDRIGMLGLTPETSAGLVAMATRPGAVAASSAWAARNGCDARPHAQTVADGVVKTSWSGCDADVELYTITAGGHTWPGSNGMGAYEGLLGPVSPAVHANDVIWDFFTAKA